MTISPGSAILAYAIEPSGRTGRQDWRRFDDQFNALFTVDPAVG